MAAPVIEVAAGLVFREGRLLIAQRLKGDHLEGLWEFPGGKRESAEGWDDCLRRELHEELGIEVEVGRLIWQVTHPYTDCAVDLRFYYCRWHRHEPIALGCQSFAWIVRGELGRFDFPPADAGLLDRLREDDALWGS